ncbi:hypothetical protein BEI60_24650 [Eisenbergiella tayi]|nr:hypothetical protein BEI60_24650 [Eisenbergiella tayi]
MAGADGLYKHAAGTYRFIVFQPTQQISQKKGLTFLHPYCIVIFACWTDESPLHFCSGNAIVA